MNAACRGEPLFGENDILSSPTPVQRHRRELRPARLKKLLYSAEVQNARQSMRLIWPVLNVRRIKRDRADHPDLFDGCRLGFIMLDSFQLGAEPKPRPGWLVLFLGGHAERDAAVERHDFELDVEALAILVRPGAADAGPECPSCLRGRGPGRRRGSGFAAIAAGVVVWSVIVFSCSLLFQATPIAALRHKQQSRGQSGAEPCGAHRASGKLGATFRGNRFSACPDRRRL